MAKGQDEVAALKRIIEITGALNSTLNVDELLELIMSSAAELLEAETSSLLLLDEESGDLVIHIATGEPGEQVEQDRMDALIKRREFEPFAEIPEYLVVGGAADKALEHSGVKAAEPPARERPGPRAKAPRS